VAITGPSGTVDWTFARALDRTDPQNETAAYFANGGKLLANGRTQIVHLVEHETGEFAHGTGTFIVRSGGTVVELYLNVISNLAWGGGNPVCAVKGTATLGV
jgi:hypothetical protein